MRIKFIPLQKSLFEPFFLASRIKLYEKICIGRCQVIKDFPEFSGKIAG